MGGTIHFDDLPVDVILEILAHLRVTDIVRCRSVRFFGVAVVMPP